MKISTKGRYALRMLIDLSLHQKDGFVSLNDIARRENISKKYLEQIVPELNHSGILYANRGHTGGYRLACPVDQINVYDILQATEGSMACVTCLDETHDCLRKTSCPTLLMWEGFDRLTKEYFSKITLKDLITHQKD